MMKKRRDILSMSVNIAVLLFLGYAVLGPRGPLRTAVQGYFAERDARSAAEDALGQLASNEGLPTLIEFTDFQCPYCRDMHDVLKQGVAEGKFEHVTMHFPLDRIHPLARPAAKASLCAEAQASATEMNSLLMSTSEWMDEPDWVQLARDARVPDLAQYEKCLVAPSTEQELERHGTIAGNIGIRATPTFVSHGGVRSGVATLDELVELTKK